VRSSVRIGGVAEDVSLSHNKYVIAFALVKMKVRLLKLTSLSRIGIRPRSLNRPRFQAHHALHNQAFFAASASLRDVDAGSRYGFSPIPAVRLPVLGPEPSRSFVAVSEIN
jgi:hypothetical protein